MRTTLRLLQTAPPDTFLVFERGTDKLLGSVRHHTHIEGEPYWTVGTDPEAPSYSERSDVVRALQNEPTN
jgi:hypothetical protein